MEQRKTGVPFEKAVAEVQRLLAPGSDVQHNVKLKDRNGCSRQFDVVLRMHAGGHNLFGVIECKDLTRRVDVGAVEAFKTKSEAVGADFRVLVSASGFTPAARDAAVNYGIGVISLVPDGPSAEAQAFPAYGYLIVYQWGGFEPVIGIVGECPADAGATCVSEFERWLQLRISEYIQHPRQPGLYFFEASFTRAVRINAWGRSALAVSVGMLAKLERTILRKPVLLAIDGQGFYDWRDSSVSFRGPTKLTVQVQNPGREGWEQYDGSFPTKAACGFVMYEIPRYSGRPPSDEVAAFIGSDLVVLPFGDVSIEAGLDLIEKKRQQRYAEMRKQGIVPAGQADQGEGQE